MSDVFSNVLSKVSVRPQTSTGGAINGVAIDTTGFDNLMVSVEVGATTGTPTSFTVAAKVQESDDGSTSWTDVTGAAITTITAIDKSAQISVVNTSGKTRKVWYRVVVTPAFVGGTTPTVAVAAIALLGGAERGPVANSIVGA